MSRRILVAVPTYRRALGLARLLQALTRLRVPEEVALQVAVIDNCPAASARALTLRMRERAAFPISWHHVPRPGLAQVRNRALDLAEDAGAEFVGFIDDDEWPGPGWLLAHLAVLERTGAEASFGPVTPVYDFPPKRWLRRGEFHASPRWPDGALLTEGYSSNVLFSLAPVRRHGLRFDAIYDRSGGEDTAFFDAYRSTGARLVHTSAASVREHVPAERMRLSWLTARWRRTGQTSARLRLSAPPGAARLGPVGCLVSGGGRIAAGTLILAAGAPAMPFGGVLWAKGLRIAMRGAGYVDAGFGRSSVLYRGSGIAPRRASSAERLADTPSAMMRKSEISCGR